MREYETVYILKTSTLEKEVQEVEERLIKMIQSNKGEIVFNRALGKKVLAFPMEKEKEGIYVHLDYSGTPSIVADIEKSLRLDERVLRFMTVLLQKEVDVPKRIEELKAQAEALAAQQALAATNKGESYA